MIKQYEINKNDESRVSFISEALQYINTIFDNGTALQKSEVLDLLFDLSNDVLDNNKECCEVMGL